MAKPSLKTSLPPYLFTTSHLVVDKHASYILGKTHYLALDCCRLSQTQHVVYGPILRAEIHASHPE